MRTTILFDTETTGLLKPKAQGLDSQPYITELFALKIEEVEDGYNIIGKFNHLIKPPVPLSAEITKITGITNEALSDKPSFCEVYEELAELFVGCNRLVAHNLSFDRSMLANELLRIDKVLRFPWPTEHLCTVEASLYVEQRRLSMTRLHEYLFAEKFKDAHRARGDVMALYSCYKEMIHRGMIK